MSQQEDNVNYNQNSSGNSAIGNDTSNRIKSGAPSSKGFRPPKGEMRVDSSQSHILKQTKSLVTGGRGTVSRSALAQID